MDNATTGLNVLFQRGVGPSHILLLQEIRVHNSPVHGAQPIAYQKELHLCWQTRSGARQQETERVSSQKVVLCSRINKYQRQMQLPNIVQLHEQWLTHKPFNEFICTFAEIFPSMFCPQHFSKPYPSYLFVLLSTSGSIHIPNLTPPWTSPSVWSPLSPPKEVRRQGIILLHETAPTIPISNRTVHLLLVREQQVTGREQFIIEH